MLRLTPVADGAKAVDPVTARAVMMKDNLDIIDILILLEKLLLEFRFNISKRTMITKQFRRFLFVLKLVYSKCVRSRFISESMRVTALH